MRLLSPQEIRKERDSSSIELKRDLQKLEKTFNQKVKEYGNWNELKKKEQEFVQERLISLHEETQHLTILRDELLHSSDAKRLEELALSLAEREEQVKRLETEISLLMLQAGKAAKRNFDDSAEIEKLRADIAAENALLASKMAQAEQRISYAEEREKIASEAQNEAYDAHNSMELEFERVSNLLAELARKEKAFEESQKASLQFIKDERWKISEERRALDDARLVFDQTQKYVLNATRR